MAGSALSWEALHTAPPQPPSRTANPARPALPSLGAAPPHAPFGLVVQAGGGVQVHHLVVLGRQVVAGALQVGHLGWVCEREPRGVRMQTDEELAASRASMYRCTEHLAWAFPHAALCPRRPPALQHPPA